MNNKLKKHFPLVVVVLTTALPAGYPVCPIVANGVVGSNGASSINKGP
ncbi:MAG: hypothetical protein ACP5SG_06195 [Dissulfurimicrobium sp.]|nr:hypothetical protein [Dissulfurimicrobium hydrothermale]UKL14555.1 hypothetical protein LGS26_04840 [Dissulfurimicrobium hydrothermale]